MQKMTSWHVGVAAEAFAAAQFARFRYDVSVQYGANQPEYDLIAGGWGLTQSYKKGCDYHEAIQKWLDGHHKKTIFCLVQFQGTAENEMPRMYLASPAEIAEVMNASAGGRGETILYEYHKWGPRAAGSGTIDRIPEEWKFTEERAQYMFETYGR